MKTFLWENKEKLILLLILTLCMVSLRTVNIHQVWYYLTPWEDLGAPPETVQRITRIDLPGENGSIDEFVYVKVSTGDFFGCCGLAKDTSNGWIKLDRPYADFYDIADSEENVCIERIEAEWGFREDLPNTKNNGDAGQCFPHMYAVYQIKQDGSVWKKFGSEDKPKLFKEVSFEFVFFVYLGYLVFLAFAWMCENHIVSADDLQAERHTKPFPAWLLPTSLIALALGATVFHYRTDPTQLIRTEFTGEYLLYSSLKIDLYTDQTFHMKLLGNIGEPFEDDGYYVIEEGSIKLIGSSDNIFVNKLNLIPVKWGQRKYLIPTFFINDFCEAVRHSGSRKATQSILYYLHDDNWKLSAEGEPRFVDGRQACP
jgi:hypothetical protein